MKRIHKTEFQVVKAMGRIGDRGTDGRLIGTGTIYQAHGPTKFVEKTVRSKARKDYAKAKNHWGADMRHWIWVTNQDYGPEVAKIIRTESGYQDAVIWTPTDVADLAVEKLGLGDLSALFGSPPSWREAPDGSFGNLVQVVDSWPKPPTEWNPAKLDAPSSSKLKYNQFTPYAEDLIRSGMRHRSDAVEALEATPTRGMTELLAGAMNAQYRALKHMGLNSDAILAQLRQDIVDALNNTPKAEIVAQALISFYFETCDAFEDVP